MVRKLIIKLTSKDRRSDAKEKVLDLDISQKELTSSEEKMKKKPERLRTSQIQEESRQQNTNPPRGDYFRRKPRDATP